MSNKRIGITTTVPVEVIFAAGDVPCDLNNVFITDEGAGELVELAELDGFPRNFCNWVKGIYSAVVHRKAVDAVVGVLQGDCSNTKVLLETLQHLGVEVIPFAYPYERNRDTLAREIEHFIRRLGTSWEKTERIWHRLKGIRKALVELDELTWREGQVSGEENHIWLVSSSDFWGDYEKFEEELMQFLKQARRREKRKDFLRLGFVGVPPIFTDLYSYLEEHGARVVFNEVQRQFAMPYEAEDLVEQYLKFTYPYDVFTRIEDIREEVQRRKICGIIHYVQSFCFRQVEDIILRKELAVPILTLEGERPGKLDARTRLRVDTFLELLRGGL